MNRHRTVLLSALMLAATFAAPGRADATVISFDCSMSPNSFSAACPKFSGSGLTQIELTFAITQNASGLFHTETGYPGGSATFTRSQQLFDVVGFDSPFVMLAGTRSIPTLTTTIDTAGGPVALSGQGTVLNTTQFSPYVGAGDFTFRYLPIGGASMITAVPAGDITWQFLDVFAPSAVSAHVSYTFGDAQTAVPEPASMLLIGTGLAGFATRRYRRARR